MDSLSLYYSFQKKYSNNKYTTDISKLNEIGTLINQIYMEIFNPPAPFEESSFMNEVIHTAEGRPLSKSLWTSKVFISDAYIVVQGLKAYMKDPGFIAKNYFKGCEKYLFNGAKINDDEIRQVAKIKDLLMQLREKTNVMQSEDTLNRKQASEIDKPQFHSPDNTYTKTDSVNETEVQPPKKSEQRLAQKQVNIQLWHDEQAGISAKLMEMQPTVSQLLKDFMTFSNNITEQYVLQFARMQIELFNSMFDLYTYHKKKAEALKHQDYINAIYNYNEFMFSIIENLSVFGIEEIRSNPGTRFDGMIHEPDTATFSTKTALIEQSIKTGFRYKDIILQKEKIKIKR